MPQETIPSKEELIDTIIKEYRESMNGNVLWSVLRTILEKHLSNTNNLMDINNPRRFWKMARFIRTIPIWKTYWYACKEYILKIEKLPYEEQSKNRVVFGDERIY